MKDFLKKYAKKLTPEQITEIETAYKEANPDAEGLPVHISKSRLDVEITKKKTAEDALKALEDSLPTKIKEATKPLEDQLSAIPKTWKEDLEKKDAELTATKKTLEQSEKLYGAKAKNTKAVLALVDPTKDFDKELERIKTSDPYLFGEGTTPPPKGTGKKEDVGGGKKDDGELTENAMRHAMGLPTKKEGE